MAGFSENRGTLPRVAVPNMAIKTWQLAVVAVVSIYSCHLPVLLHVLTIYRCLKCWLFPFIDDLVHFTPMKKKHRVLFDYRIV